MNLPGTLAAAPLHRNLRTAAQWLASGCGALAMLAGWLHGAAPRLPLPWHEGDAFDPSAMAGPLELLIAGVAAANLWRRAPAGTVGVPGFLFAASLLIPGSLAGNGALLVFGLWAAWRSAGPGRAGALLFAGLAACGLWWTLGERLTGGAALRADATAAAWLLHWFMPGVQHAGNIAGVPGGHEIAVLAGCATVNGLPLALLGLAALSLRNGRLGRGFALRAAALSLGYTAINLVRLCLLASGPEAYRIGHGVYGQIGFDTLATLLPLLLAARTPQAAAPAGLPAPRAGWLSVTGLTGLLTAGLLFTLTHAPDTGGAPRDIRAVAAASQFLAKNGWVPAGRGRLTSEDGSDLLIFEHAGCPSRLSVAVVPQLAEAAGIVRAVLGAHVLWLDAGRLSNVQPRTSQAWRELWAAGLARLSGGRNRTMPPLAIAGPIAPAPAACSLPPAEAWLELAQLP